MESIRPDCQKQNPNMTKKLTPYQILGKLTIQRKRKWYEVKMEELQLYQKIHTSVFLEEPLFIRALQCDHSGMNLDISTFSQKRLRKTTHQFCCILKKRRFNQIRRTCFQEVLERTEAGKQCTSHSCRHWIQTPTRSTSRTLTWWSIMTWCLWLIWNRRKIRWNFSKRRSGASSAATQFRQSSSQR